MAMVETSISGSQIHRVKVSCFKDACMVLGLIQNVSALRRPITIAVRLLHIRLSRIPFALLPLHSVGFDVG